MGPSRLAPGERIPGLDRATVGDFWAWAYSDILENTARGIFAEFLVGNALRVVKGVRPSGWGTFDLRYGDWKIEVKSSAYLQSWHQTALSTIQFDVAEREGWDPETNLHRPERMRSADCYVFCLYAEKDRSQINALNTSMWEFYVLSTGRINRELKTQKSAGLKRIKSMTEPVGYDQLKKRVDRVLGSAD